MKNTPRKKTGKCLRFSLVGFLAFLAPIAVTVICAVFVFDGISDATDGNKGLIALALLAVILLCAAVCTLIDYFRRRRTVDRPVREILAATERIATGDFTVRLHLLHAYGNYDEYDLIKENLNKMAAELSQSAVMNKDFVANVSHELKTPLAVIRNYAAALQSGRLNAAERAEYAEELVAAAGRLSDLVANVLRLNKLEHQAIPPAVEKVALGEQLRECVLQFEEKIESKGIELICDIDDVTVVSAAGYLEIIWNNLLSNAVKFTGAGGRITVTLKACEGRAVVGVEDTGCGMTAATGARIFDRFYQGDTSHSREGNGLGLALVKQIIDLLGGEIKVASVVGQGSKFTVALNGVEQETAE